jgi:hypothetical protein
MRYALRKQDKIKEVLGKKYLENNILQSLNKYFENSDNDRIYSDIDEYVTFGEYDAKTIRKAVLETGYYGEIYKWLYYQSKK